MLYSILLAIALICVSGFIAYFGDLLGRRMGKKRLTLFNLRPRHTAIIVTTITGMLISTMALIVLISADSQFRKVFTQGKLILERNEKLQAENSGLIQRGKKLKDEVRARRKEVISARRDTAAARVEREKAISAVARLEKDIALKSRELNELRRKTDVVESELRAKTAELDHARADLRRAQSKLMDAQARLTDAEARLKETESRLKAKTAEYEELSKKTGEYAIQSWITREREVILNQGDELIRGTINPRQSEFGLRADLYRLLEHGGTRASELGAVPGANGRAVTVVSHVYSKSPGQEMAVLYTNEGDLIDKAVKTIRSSPLEVVVQIIGGVNTVRGEQAQVELQLYVNKLVYIKGDKIADAKIDGRQSEVRVLLRLMDFWKQEVSKTAVNAGIIAAVGSGRGEAGRNPEEQLDELFKVLDDVRATNDMADVTVYANTDIYAGDLLDVTNVRFAVTRAD